MSNRIIEKRQLTPLGLGCMGLSHGYGPAASEADAGALLLGALDAGVNFFDTAALYGNGANESLVGRVLRAHRQRVFLASKCGLNHPASGLHRRVDGRPDAIRASCEASLTRLRTDVIDLFYLHRLDREVPIEDSVGALADLVRAGKVRAIGLSEVSADTLRRAHAVHPVAAVQSEYSLWTRNPEIAVLTACRELGVTFVAFSPLGRGYLSNRLRGNWVPEVGDIRHSMPRFNTESLTVNMRLLDRFVVVAAEAACTPAQLALAWLLHRAPFIIPIPGTTNLAHLKENMMALDVVLAPDTLIQLDRLFDPGAVHGPRYNAQTQAEIDTENF